jgi:dolichol-phosphate mannosyltransferase
MRLLVATATYNEAENIRPLVEQIRAQLPDAHVLVIDDASPDGTGAIADELRASSPQVHVIHRPGKNGLGSAHKLAMKYALAQGYDALVTMDADFSHHPKYLPDMVRHLADSEFVIGSRYTAGGSLDYPPARVALSRGANLLTRLLLSIPLAETTTAYRGYRRSLLERFDIDAIHADGYDFMVEALSAIAGMRPTMSEFPIHFADRERGESKITRKEIVNGITTLGRLALRRAGRALGRDDGIPPVGEPPAACPACGGIHFARATDGRPQCLICGRVARRDT